MAGRTKTGAGTAKTGAGMANAGAETPTTGAGKAKAGAGRAKAGAGKVNAGAGTPPAAVGSVRAPNGVVGDLAVHAEALADAVRSELGRLANAKITAADAAALVAGAARLRAAEGEWVDAQRAATPGNVARARAALTAGRKLLFGGIGAFVEHPAAKRELKRIGGVENDADLDADAARLVVLARRYAGDLDGTEVTPAAVDQMESDLAAFRAARAGAAGDSASKAAVQTRARDAAAARNAAYWSLLALDKLVCKRGRFRFRDDATRRAAFGAFSTERKRGVKKAAATTRRKKTEKTA
jgi:putative membrane protein